MANCYVRGGEFSGYLFTGKLDRSMWGGIGAGNPATVIDWSTAGEQGKVVFVLVDFPFVEEGIILLIVLVGGASVGFVGLRAAAI